MHLLFSKVNQLGDNVVFLNVVQTFRRLWPEARITVLTTPVAAGLYRSVPGHVFVRDWPRSEFNRLWRRPLVAWRLRRDLRADRPTAALVSFDQGSFAHLLARYSGARIRLGSARLAIRAPDGLTHRIDTSTDAPIAAWNWAMGRALAEILGRGADWPPAPIAPDLSALIPLAGGFPASAPPQIVIHPGSSLAYRRWPVERFVAVAGRLAAHHRVAWIETGETSAVNLPSSVSRLAPSTIEALTAALANAQLFIGNNSGPMHVANALGLRGVVVSGPSHPHWDPFWQRERWTVLRRNDLTCLPCETLATAPGHCTRAMEPHACLLGWSVDEVVKASLRNLADDLSPPRPNL